MKGQCLCFFLIIKNDLDLAFLAREPVFEPLRMASKPFSRRLADARIVKRCFSVLTLVRPL